jgi:hypothetical protein
VVVAATPGVAFGTLIYACGDPRPQRGANRKYLKEKRKLVSFDT